MTRPVRVLVVDDSAFARRALRQMLSSAEPAIEVVDAARNGLEALEKIRERCPDVVTLDLVMPDFDGLAVLEALASFPSAPRVVVVTMSDEHASAGVRALESGAFDVVHKPTALATDRLYELRDELVRKVMAAARREPRPARPRASFEHPGAPPRPVAIIVVGASTGGPQAVSQVVKALPARFAAPIAVALHMPVGYTEAFAERLGAESALRVVEARDGQEFGPGDVVIARAGMHLRLEPTGARATARLDVVPVEALHKPSVDVLFASAARGWGDAALGVVMTGMGTDGLDGARVLRAAGARVLAESAESCVIYGMPRAVVEANVATRALHLDQMAGALLEYAGMRAP